MHARPVDLAPLIDHTLLHPGATDADLMRLAMEAVEHSFAAVCVNSRAVPLVARALAGTPVRVVSVAGFPLGASLSAVKATEAELAVRLGAHEIDMVLSVGDLLAGERGRVRDDISEVRRAVPAAILKVILECGLLPSALRREGALIAAEAGADFVKTSTGSGPGGATVEDVRLLRETVGPHVGVKASGGIRTFAEALAMVRAGANRLGTSAGVAIVSTPGCQLPVAEGPPCA